MRGYEELRVWVLNHGTDNIPILYFQLKCNLAYRHLNPTLNPTCDSARYPSNLGMLSVQRHHIASFPNLDVLKLLLHSGDSRRAYYDNIDLAIRKQVENKAAIESITDSKRKHKENDIKLGYEENHKAKLETHLHLRSAHSSQRKSASERVW